MQLVCGQSCLKGAVDVPGSKSHTIRAVTICSLAAGDSVIREPLSSGDTLAAVDTFRALGAEIAVERNAWRVRGCGGELKTPENFIDVRNSGTTLRLAVGAASLLREGLVGFTGDHQIRRRPIGPLVQSLNDLGARVSTTRNNGCAPLIVGGRLCGGRTSIEAVTSQFLSSLLLCTPLADGDSVIDVPLLNEQPYVHITLDWLARTGIRLERDELKQFRVPGRQQYRPTDVRVAADFSSATFFLAAGALSGNDVLVRGLDMNDPQGDKAVIEYLRQMGAKIEIGPEGVHVRPGDLIGCEIDMNATPDALPMMSVVGCFAKGETRLVNVPQARLKETDRIAVMAAELGKMGAKISERPDGLIVKQSDLRPADVQGHDDHRVVMSLAIAGCMIASGTRVSTAEAMSVTFPTFVDCVTSLNGRLELQD